MAEKFKEKTVCQELMERICKDSTDPGIKERMDRINKLQETFGILNLMAEKAGRPPIPDKEWLTTEPEYMFENYERSVKNELVGEAARANKDAPPIIQKIIQDLENGKCLCYFY